MLQRLRKMIMENLGFSKSEANGILVLTLLIILFAIVPRIYFSKVQSKWESFNEDEEMLKKWVAEVENSIQTAEETPSTNFNQEKIEISTFPFDPNTVTKAELLKLGFSSYAANNMLSYREAGGSFKGMDDLKKIYGISQQRLKELEEYISFPSFEVGEPEEKPAAVVVVKADKSHPKIEIDLNSATMEELQMVSGIGPVLSERIIKFRDLLGGFISHDQLNEVYGLDSTVAQTLKKQSTITGSPDALNINTDSLKELYQHPYINYQTSRVILNYRKQHGSFDSVDDIKEIKIISDSLYQKIYPYLSIDP